MLKSLFLGLVFWSVTFPGASADWSQWRGPAFNGSSAESRLPVRWGTNENVRWVTPLPGYSAATPVTWGDAIFLASPDENKDLLLLCVDGATGAVRWKDVVSTGDREKGRNNMASCSPVADAERVYAIFATGDLVAYSHAGKRVWKRALGSEYGPFANMWIYGSSPMLHDGRLYVQVLQRSPVPRDYAHAQGATDQRESFLLCLDPRTGTNFWRAIRKSDAVEESQEAYTTPVPMEGQNGWEILVLGADYLTAHSPADGTELWRRGGLNPNRERFWRIVPSPLIAKDLIIACGPKRDPVYAFRPGKVVPADRQIAWKKNELTSDCVTPLYYQGRLYVLDGDRQNMVCVQPETGAKVWEGKLDTREIFRASPTGADGRIYCIAEGGTVFVLQAGDQFKVLETFRMGEGPVRASIVAANGRLLIRTGKQLWCAQTATPTGK